MMNNTYVIGDIHGGFKALTQVFERAPLKEGDTIIQLGDICDGYNEVYECVDYLIKQSNKYIIISLEGNHDNWFSDWIKYGIHGVNWNQGGEGTLYSYCNNLDRDYVYNFNNCVTSLLVQDLPQTHINFFAKQRLYYIDSENRFYVHGGFNRHHFIDQIEAIEPYTFYWDRDLWYSALGHHEIQRPFKIKEDFKEIFIGHTTTMNWKKDTPMNAAGKIWNVDTGAGFSGKLTIMDVNTKEYWQSDNLRELYPNWKGRN